MDTILNVFGVNNGSGQKIRVPMDEMAFREARCVPFIQVIVYSAKAVADLTVLGPAE